MFVVKHTMITDTADRMLMTDNVYAQVYLLGALFWVLDYLCNINTELQVVSGNATAVLSIISSSITISFVFSFSVRCLQTFSSLTSRRSNQVRFCWVCIWRHQSWTNCSASWRVRHHGQAIHTVANTEWRKLLERCGVQVQLWLLQPVVLRQTAAHRTLFRRPIPWVVCVQRQNPALSALILLENVSIRLKL